MTIVVLMLHLITHRPRYRVDLAEPPVLPATTQETATVDRPPRLLRIVQRDSFILPFQGEAQ